jgi:hypothetical protein
MPLMVTGMTSPWAGVKFSGDDARTGHQEGPHYFSYFTYYSLMPSTYRGN